MRTRPAQPGQTGHTPQRIHEMLRVDHAGECAAVSIYKAQQKVFAGHGKTHRVAQQTTDILAQEQKHLDEFNALLREYGTRPSALMPLWHLASHGLGTVMALMGEKAAHTCTEAVETVIGKHYNEQAQEVKDRHPALSKRFETYRDEELAHRTLAQKEGAAQAPAYPLLSAIIKTGCRTAIKISEKI